MTETNAPFIAEEFAQFTTTTDYGEFTFHCFPLGNTVAFALTKGLLPTKNLLVRVQSPCLISEAFGVDVCDCASQLHQSLHRGSQEPSFLLVYLGNQEGRGHGIVQKMRTFSREIREQLDTVEAFHRDGLPIEMRKWDVAATIIKQLNGDQPIRLMTNYPAKVKGLEENGVQVSERVPLLIEAVNEHGRKYLIAKRDKMGQILPQV